MDYQIELVARAFYDVEYEDGVWEFEADYIKQEFRDYASNAIDLLHEDIGVLLMALEGAAAEGYRGRPRAA